MYPIHLLTINKVRHAQGSTTITFDELFLILNKILKENIFNFNEYKTIPLRSLIGTDKCPNHERVNLQISKSVYHSSYLETVSGTVRFRVAQLMRPDLPSRQDITRSRLSFRSIFGSTHQRYPQINVLP